MVAKTTPQASRALSSSCRVATERPQLAVMPIRSRRKYSSTANRLPKCRATSNARPWSGQPVRAGTRIRWAELETGRNSVRPWSRASTTTCNQSIYAFAPWSGETAGKRASKPRTARRSEHLHDPFSFRSAGRQMAQQQCVPCVDSLRPGDAHHMAGARCDFGWLPMAVLQRFQNEAVIAGGGHEFHPVAQGKAILYLDAQPVILLLQYLADELVTAHAGVAALVVLIHPRWMAAVEALGIAAVGQARQIGQQGHVEGPAGHGIVDRLAVGLHGTGDVEMGLGAALDLQRVDAHLDEPGYMLNRPQVLGVHDVGAVLVFLDGHLLVGLVALVEQVQRLGLGLHHQRLDIAFGGLPGRLQIVFPAAGVGAGALVGIAVVEVARQQAAPGVGDAQGSMNEDLQFHVRALATDLLALLQRQLTEDNDH